MSQVSHAHPTQKEEKEEGNAMDSNGVKNRHGSPSTPKLSTALNLSTPTSASSNGHHTTESNGSSSQTDDDDALQKALSDLRAEEAYLKELQDEVKILKEGGKMLPEGASAVPLSEPSCTLDSLRENLAAKERLLQQYSTEMKSKKPSDPADTRATYTRRVSDYLRSVEKQSQETENILASIRQTQKDINMTEGKLDRTYREVEATVFQVARRDPTLVSSYKLLTELHATCAAIVATESKYGKAKREAMEVRARADAEEAAIRSREIAKRRAGDVSQAAAEPRNVELARLREENQAMREKLKMEKKS